MIQFAGMLIAMVIYRLLPKRASTTRRVSAKVRRTIIALLVLAMLAGFIFSYFWGPPRP